MRDFRVRDPSGKRIGFASRVVASRLPKPALQGVWSSLTLVATPLNAKIVGRLGSTDLTMSDKKPTAVEEMRALAASSPEAHEAVRQFLSGMPDPSDKDIEDHELHDWVKQLVYLIRRVADGKVDYSENALFWVRLYGFFDDVHRIVESTRPPCPRDLRDLLDELLDVFNVDERLYLNYRRDKESHPRLGSWRKDAKSTKRWITGRSWTGAEAHAGIIRVIHKYQAIFETGVHVMPGLDESRIAVGMAQKLIPKLEKIGIVIDREFGDWRKTRLLWAEK
jgi:hypothetical protein